MAAISLQPVSHVRKVNIRQDLLDVADLIELCFASTLDEDGRDYLRQLRWTARDASYLSWLQGAAERISMPLYGFVWEEGGHIVGNLSLIPIYRRGKIFYLIANVAVHPNFRRRGIGRQLTQTAVDHLRQRGIDSAWLQVRDDNPGAQNLYRSLGFVECARRTTWQSGATPPFLLRHNHSSITVHPRRGEDWPQQLAWLRRAYPPEVAWNLPINLASFRPSAWNALLTYLRGDRQQHWTAWQGDAPVGFLTWELAHASADVLWLAAPEQDDERAILALLPAVRELLAHRQRPLTLNYAAERGGDAFLRAGFVHHQTLVWMKMDLALL